MVPHMAVDLSRGNGKEVDNGVWGTCLCSSLVPSDLAHLWSQIHHFHFLRNFCWAHSMLWLSGSDRTKLMLNSSGCVFAWYSMAKHCISPRAQGRAGILLCMWHGLVPAHEGLCCHPLLSLSIHSTPHLFPPLIPLTPLGLLAQWTTTAWTCSRPLFSPWLHSRPVVFCVIWYRGWSSTPKCAVCCLQSLKALGFPLGLPLWRGFAGMPLATGLQSFYWRSPLSLCKACLWPSGLNESYQASSIVDFSLSSPISIMLCM